MSLAETHLRENRTNVFRSYEAICLIMNHIGRLFGNNTDDLATLENYASMLYAEAQRLAGYANALASSASNMRLDRIIEK